MIYNNNWAFIHIPKTGGTNFIERCKIFPEIINGNDNRPKHYNHQPLQWWLDQKILSPNLIFFTFVRNPYSRMVSLYNHILTSNKNIPSFNEFIENNILMKLESKINNVNFKFSWPQYKYFENKENIKVNVFKIESDLGEVEKLVNIKFKDIFVNSRPHLPWQNYYTKKTKTIVLNVWKEDFELFSYDKDF